MKLKELTSYVIANAAAIKEAANTGNADAQFIIRHWDMLRHPDNAIVGMMEQAVINYKETQVENDTNSNSKRQPK